MLTSDEQAWHAYKHHRNWFNKLWLSELLNYSCGPCGTSVPQEGEYVVRPIYNLHGMGSGSSIKQLQVGDTVTVPPGYFWCEKFTGDHLSIDLKWNSVSGWGPLTIYQGNRCNDSELFRFTSWKKVKRTISIPEHLDILRDCKYINIETIGGKIIEVHLRVSPDPQYDEIIPVWSDKPLDTCSLSSYKFVPSFDEVLGTNVKRIGFYCK